MCGVKSYEVGDACILSKHRESTEQSNHLSPLILLNSVALIQEA